MSEFKRKHSILFSYIAAVAIAAGVVGSAIALSASKPQIDDLKIEDLIQKTKSDSRDKRISAYLELSKFREQPATVVPVVVRAAADKEELVRIAGEISLRRIGAVASDHLGKFVDAEDPKTYVLGCAAVKSLGPDASRWAPKIIDRLSSNDRRVRLASLFALENIGDDALPAMKRLISLLDDKDFNIQCGACRVLAALGTKSAPAQDRLVVLLKEGNVSARGFAAIALGASGLSDKHDILKLLNQRLDAFTQVEKQRALLGLAHLGDAAKPSAARVRELMNQPAKNVQATAAYALWKITGDADPTVKLLIELSQLIDYESTSIELLGDMGPAAAKATGMLTKKLRSPEANIREVSVIALNKLGPIAKPAVPELRRMLTEEKDLVIRAAVEDALAAIETTTGSPPDEK